MKPIRPLDLAVFRDEKMGKSTLYQSEDLLLGLNSFQPGQEHASHVHADMDKAYLVLEGEGVFSLDDEEWTLGPGEMLVAPRGRPHGVRNESGQNLVVLAVLAPSP